MLMQAFKAITTDKAASSEISRERYSLDQKGISQWLLAKGIISHDEILFSYSDIMRWTRTGAETYSTSFEIKTNNYEKIILIKAIVTTTPKKSLIDWTKRRELLMRNGIVVSHWYHTSDAIIFEDYYPNTSQVVAFEKLLSIGKKLDSLGFTTIKFTDDIMADTNGNPYFVDFGFDLGEPTDICTRSAKNYLLKNFSERQNQIIQFYDRNDH